MSIIRANRAAGYDPPMPLVNRFVHHNGRSVSKHVTDSGVTAYVADEVPLDALLGLERKLMDPKCESHETQGAEDVRDAADASRNHPLG